MNIEAMSVEQMTAELKRIARWMHDMVQTHDQHEEESSPGYCSEFDSLLDSEGGTISRIAARLSGMEADTWQPIETAPFDGTKVLALGPVGPDVMYWNVEDEYWVDPYVVLNGSEPCRPSFWMPIPPEPPHV